MTLRRLCESSVSTPSLHDACHVAFYLYRHLHGFKPNAIAVQPNRNIALLNLYSVACTTEQRRRQSTGSNNTGNIRYHRNESHRHSASPSVGGQANQPQNQQPKNKQHALRQSYNNQNQSQLNMNRNEKVHPLRQTSSSRPQQFDNRAHEQRNRFDPQNRNNQSSAGNNKFVNNNSQHKLQQPGRDKNVSSPTHQLHLCRERVKHFENFLLNALTERQHRDVSLKDALKRRDEYMVQRQRLLAKEQQQKQEAKKRPKGTGFSFSSLIQQRDENNNVQGAAATRDDCDNNLEAQLTQEIARLSTPLGSILNQYQSELYAASILAIDNNRSSQHTHASSGMRRQRQDGGGDLYCICAISSTRDIIVQLLQDYGALGRLAEAKRLFNLAVQEASFHCNSVTHQHDAHKGADTGVELNTPESSSAPMLLLSSAVFDTFLQLLGQQNAISKQEIKYVLHKMDSFPHIERTALTYQTLIEINLTMRHECGCIDLWNEMTARGRTRSKPQGIESRSDHDTAGVGVISELRRVVPTPNILRLMIKGVILPIMSGNQNKNSNTQSITSSSYQPDVLFIMDVIRHYLAICDITDRDILLSLYKLLVDNPDAGPEDGLWLLFEIEQRCVVDSVSLKQVVDRTTFTSLLLKCAKCGDSVTAERILSCMERHFLPRTMDVLALCLWTYAAAQKIELAFDLLEEMVRKGFLEQTDINKKWIVEDLNWMSDRHFLNILGESMNTVEMVDRAYFHLEARHRQGKSVSVDSLDIVVMACGRLGDEDRAVETMESYASLGVHPRTKSYNALLLSCAGRNKARQHKTVFEAMLRNGVTPNYHTFRLLIRQAVLCDNIEEALEFLEKAPTYKGVFVDVEMMLPIVERAAFVGDEATVLHMMTKAIHADVGFSPTITRAIVQRLSNHGINTDAVAELIPVHEKLRTKTGLGRRRPR